MSGKALAILAQAFIATACMRGAESQVSGSKNRPALQSPATFRDDAGARFLRLEWQDFGKVHITLRTSSGPGSFSRWHGDGRQTEKVIAFTQTIEDGSESGTEYLATVGPSKLTVKIKPGQNKTQDVGVIGVYHRVTDEKLTSLAKKDSEAAEKLLNEGLKLAAKKAAAVDKPAFAEWKHRWPDLRSKLVSLGTKPSDAENKPPIASKPPVGQATPLQLEKTADQWMALAEISAAGLHFISQSIPAGTKLEWDGEYEDRFGGTVSLKTQKSGEMLFDFRCTRGKDSQEATYGGSCPPQTIKGGSDGKDATADFTDKNSDVKDGAQQTRVHFQRRGHFLIVDIEYPRLYMVRSWFDGVYLKRPPPPKE